MKIFWKTPAENMVELTGPRLWSANFYKFKFFINTFLKENIKKRLILNTLSGRF